LTKEKVLEKVGVSDSQLDSARLNDDIQLAIDSLNDEGYKVVSITSVISGSYDFDFKSEAVSSSKRMLVDTEKVSGGASYGYGYGFSYTDSLILLAEKST